MSENFEETLYAPELLMTIQQYAPKNLDEPFCYTLAPHYVNSARMLWNEYKDDPVIGYRLEEMLYWAAFRAYEELYYAQIREYERSLPSRVKELRVKSNRSKKRTGVSKKGRVPSPLRYSFSASSSNDELPDLGALEIQASPLILTSC